MKLSSILRNGIAAALAAVTLTLANAAETTYTGRPAWESAVGGAADFTVNFDALPVGSFHSSVYDAGPFTLAETGSSGTTFANEVKDPGGFGDLNVNGTRYASMFVDSLDNEGSPNNGDAKVDLVLDTAAAAWGADFNLAQETTEDVMVNLYDPSNALIATLDVLHLGTNGFWGFTTTHPTGVKRIEFFAPISSASASPAGNPFGMDNVSAAAALAVSDTPPTAAATSVPNVGLAGMGASTYSLIITYNDDNAIDVSTLGATDITISGPGGSLTVNSATPDVGSNGTPRSVTYECTPPGGTWAFSDNGTYTVAMQGSQVADDAGQFVAANATFATFDVLTGSGFATLYTNMTAFESAIGGASELDFMIDFEDFAADTDFSSPATPVNLPATGPTVATIAQAAGGNPFANFIDDLPFEGFPATQNVNGTNYALMWVDKDEPNTVELIFDTPVAAWGAMLVGAANDEDLEIDLYDAGGTLLDSLEHNFDGFYGFTSPSPGTVKRIVFKAVNSLGTTNNLFGMDDMKGAFTYTVNLDPQVASVTAPDVTIPDTGQTSYDFSIEFSDNSAIDVSTIDIGDVSVTGPGAIGTLTVTAANEPSGVDGSPKFATYTVTPPGGSWDLADNGVYTIAILGSQVADDAGNFVAEDLTLETFVVEARSNVVTDFTSKPAWTTAIGGTPDWSEDFESFATPNEDFSSAPVLSPTPGGGNFSIVRVGGSSTAGNFVDADPAFNFIEAPGVAITYAAMFVEADAGLTVEMTFDNPVLGWIGEFFVAIDEEDLEIEVHDAGGIIDLIDVNANGFLGFTYPTPTITKLVFRGAAADLASNGEIFGLDNICAHETPIGPEIDVTGLGMSIVGDGTNTPAAADDTAFGSLECGIDSPVVHTFTINNTGAELNLTGTLPDLVTLSGSSDFSVTTQPTTPVAATTGTTTFNITFTPSTVGAKTAIVSIDNDDPDENPYSFNISGTVTDVTPPVITLNGSSPVTIECGVDTYTELGATALDACDGVIGPVGVTGTVDEGTLGTYNVTYNIMDAAGNPATTVTRVVNVVDTLAPVISGAKDVVYTVPVGGTADASAHFAGISATDICEGSVAVTCSPDGTAPFPVGVTPVSCSAQDSSSNTATANFNVVVLEIADTPGTRFLTGVSVRGDSVTGAAGTVNNINRAYLNNAGTVVFSSSMSGAGSASVIARGPVAGPHTAIAVDGTASGVGDFGNFDDLTLNDSSNVGFSSLVTPNNQANFLNLSGGAASTTNVAVKDGTAPTGGGETYRSLQKPALASNGELLTRANLNLGSGAGVTTGDDTLITSSAGTVIAREGAATSIGGGVLYSGLNNRIVASENNDRYAFATALKPGSSLTNRGVFAGVLGAGSPALVVREGDVADGTGGGVFANFLGEAVNSSGETVIRAIARDAGITASNNEALWTTVGNVGGSPSLIAREGNVAPCLPTTDAAFDRFTTITIADDGSVCFFAYLRNASGPGPVNSTNDGSIWRWDGQLHLIAREGDNANNTDGAQIGRLTGFACSGTGGVVYVAEYVTNVGDYTSANRDGIYLDRGAPDGAPELIMRRGDKFDFGGEERTVGSIKISFEENPGHGTGGYGRSINDMGSVLLNLSLSGNLSGIFVISPGP